MGRLHLPSALQVAIKRDVVIVMDETLRQEIEDACRQDDEARACSDVQAPTGTSARSAAQ